MGRPKIDYSLSRIPCEFCGKMGIPLRKGACATCYMREHHRKSIKYNEIYKLKRKENAKHWNKTHPEEYKTNKLRWRLASQYGMTTEQYKKMEQEQNSLCFICKKPQLYGKILSVDHCHTTGKIRKLLCNTCNFLVASIENTPHDVMKTALDYVADHIQSEIPSEVI